MENLSDFFPERLRENFATINVVIGVVIKTFVQDTIPPKVKRFIIVGENSEMTKFAIIYINSDPNFDKIPPKLHNLHVKFDSKDRTYLDHASYIDCSRIYIKDKSWIESIISDDPQRHLGELSEEDLTLIRLTLRTAKSISLKEKKQYGFFV